MSTSRQRLGLAMLALSFAPVVAGSLAAYADGDAAPPDLLRGPTVVEDGAPSRAQPSVGFDGAMTPPEGRPEIVVLESLTLSEAEREATESIISARGVAIRALIGEHLDLFLELQSMRQAGDRAGVRERMPQLRTAALPLVEPPLSTQIAAVLEPANATAFSRGVATYREALRKQGRGESPQVPPEGAQPRAGGPRAAHLEEMLLLMREIGSTIASEVEFRRARLDEYLDLIAATPQQRSEIQSILRQSATPPATAADAGARRRIFSEIMPLLTPEQRRATIRHLRGDSLTPA